MNKNTGRPQSSRGNAPKSRAGKQKTFGETSREARFDKPRAPRSGPRDKDFSAEKRHSRSRPENKTDKPFFEKPFRKKTTEQGESRGFKGSTRDNDQGFSRDRKFESRDSGPRKREFDNDRPFRPRADRDNQGLAPKRRYESRDSGPRKREFDNDRPFRPRADRDDQGLAPKKRYESRDSGPRKREFDNDRQVGSLESTESKEERTQSNRQYKSREEMLSPLPGGKNNLKVEDQSIRLNRFIANAGICSRREADTLITSGTITINGQVVTELGTKVKPTDSVFYGDQKLQNEKKVYLLLNKPKDFITTSDDPMERKTVMDLVQNACEERIYPVGRLDRNTTGLLLLTNDGDMAKKLTHPTHRIQKLYQVTLDKPLALNDMKDISKGVKIDEVIVIPDEISFVDQSEDRKEVGIAIHSGQNRVVRRIFEQFGYNVDKLDRVMFAGLTKKDLPRGRFRFLSPKEVSFLKML